MCRKIEAGTPEHRTLFSLGWPPYCSSSEVEAVFSRVGYVTSTYMQNSAGPINRVSFIKPYHIEKSTNVLFICY